MHSPFSFPTFVQYRLVTRNSLLPSRAFGNSFFKKYQFFLNKLLRISPLRSLLLPFHPTFCIIIPLLYFFYLFSLTHFLQISYEGRRNCERYYLNQKIPRAFQLRGLNPASSLFSAQYLILLRYLTYLFFRESGILFGLFIIKKQPFKAA